MVRSSWVALAQLRPTPFTLLPPPSEHAHNHPCDFRLSLEGPWWDTPATKWQTRQQLYVLLLLLDLRYQGGREQNLKVRGWWQLSFLNRVCCVSCGLYPEGNLYVDEIQDNDLFLNIKRTIAVHSHTSLHMKDEFSQLAGQLMSKRCSSCVFQLDILHIRALVM